MELGDAVIVSVAQRTERTQLVQGEVTSLEAEIERDRIVRRRPRLRQVTPVPPWPQGAQLDRAEGLGDRREIAGEAGLSAPSTSEVAHSVHGAAGNVELGVPRRTGHEIGYDLRVADGELEFKKPSSAKHGPEQGSLGARSTEGQIVYGDNLLSFRPACEHRRSSQQRRGPRLGPEGEEAIVGTASRRTRRRPSVSRSRRQRKRSTTRPTSGTTGCSRPRTRPRSRSGARPSVGSTFGEAEGDVVGDPNAESRQRRQRVGSRLAVRRQVRPRVDAARTRPLRLPHTLHRQRPPGPHPDRAGLARRGGRTIRRRADRARRRPRGRDRGEG